MLTTAEFQRPKRIKHTRGRIVRFRGDEEPLPRMLTMDQAREIRKLRNGGATYGKIAQMFSIRSSDVYQICKMITYREDE